MGHYNLTANDKTSFNLKGYFKMTLDLDATYIDQLIEYSSQLLYNDIFLHLGGAKDENRG